MRRIIVGLDDEGKSCVAYAGPYQSIHHITSTQVGSLEVRNVDTFIEDLKPGESCVADVWETHGLPNPNDPDPMKEPQQFTMEPLEGGLRVRYFSWGPHLDSSTMHATNTLDIVYIIAGRVDLLLEEKRKISLEAGDTLVVPGSQHGWRAGPEGVCMLNVMQKLA